MQRYRFSITPVAALSRRLRADVHTCPTPHAQGFVHVRAQVVVQPDRLEKVFTLFKAQPAPHPIPGDAALAVNYRRAQDRNVGINGA